MSWHLHHIHTNFTTGDLLDRRTKVLRTNHPSWGHVENHTPRCRQTSLSSRHTFLGRVLDGDLALAFQTRKPLCVQYHALPEL